MSSEFNLLLLHKSWDTHPRSWICFKSNGLGSLLGDLETEAIRKFKTTREGLSRRISSDLGCSTCVIKRILRRKKYFPIAVVLKFLEYTDRKSKLYRKINAKVEQIKVNGASAKPIKAPRKLTKNLAQILGAFMADGSLSVTTVFASKNKEDLIDLLNKIETAGLKCAEGYSKARKEFYIAIVENRSNHEKLEVLRGENAKKLRIQTHATIELSDYYLANVESFNSWILSSFGIKPARFYKRGNAWRSYFCNKVLTRYLTTFFGVNPGYKTDIAFEPKLIRNSSLQVRKAFAKGVIMFDGCATLGGRIQLESISPSLIGSIAEIWSRDGINFGIQNNGKTIYSTHENAGSKLRDYFERGTPKHDRLSMAYGNKKPIPELDSKSKTVSLAKILMAIKTAKTCDVEFLMEKFNIKHNTATMYLRVLKRNRKIKMTTKPDFLDARFVNGRTGLFLEENTRETLFKKIREKFVYYRYVAVFLGVKTGTFSAWKVGKNRIPIRFIEKMAEITDTDVSAIYGNIVSTDRMICSLP